MYNQFLTATIRLLTKTGGDVMISFWCVNQTDLQLQYTYLLNGLQLTRGIITCKLMCNVVSL